MAIAPSVKWRNLSVSTMSLSTLEPLARRACFSSAVSMCGSGIFENATIRNARAKMPMAIISAGTTSATLDFSTLLPMRCPRMISESVPPMEFSEQPNCTSWLPLFPPPPSVLRSGFVTRLSMHMENPAMNAPATYTAKEPT